MKTDFSNTFLHLGTCLRRAMVMFCCVAMAVSMTAAPARGKRKPNGKSSQKGWFTKSKDIHLVSMYGGVGYSGLLGTYGPQTFTSDEEFGFSSSFSDKFIGGGGGIIGVNYELWHKRFIFAVGPEIRMFSSQSNLTYQTDYYRSDYEYFDQLTMLQHYNFTKFSETQGMYQLMVPILFGGQFDKVYFLAGAKIGTTFAGTWKHRGDLTTSVTELLAIDDFENMPTHFLTMSNHLDEHPLYNGTAKGKNKWGLDATLSAEVGVNLNEFFSEDWNAENEKKAHPWHLRAAFFIDYGLPIMRATGWTDNGEYNYGDIASVAEDGYICQMYGEDYPGYISTNSFYQSRYADKNKKLSSLLVGVKFSAVLQLTKPKTPNPQIYFWVTDTLSQPTATPATVLLKDVAASAKSKPKTVKMKTSGKTRGTAVKRYKEGTYWMVANANGYLPSNYGGDTVYFEHTKDMDTIHFELIPRPKLVYAVYNSETKQQIPASVQFVSRKGKEDYSRDVDSLTTANNISLTYGDEYMVVISSPNYFTDSIPLSRLTDTVAYYLRPLPRVIPQLVLHVNFAVDKADILPESMPIMDELFNYLTKYDDVNILLTGHTDSDGNEDHNQRLSEARAESVKQEMVRRGIDPARILTNGKGESEPIDTNKTAEGKRNNRRVEVSVIK